MHVSAQESTKITLTTALSADWTTSRLVSSSSTFRSHASTTACRLTSRGLRPSGAWHSPCHCTSAWHGGPCRCTPSSWSPGPLERNAGDHARGPGARNAAADPRSTANAMAVVGGIKTEHVQEIGKVSLPTPYPLWKDSGAEMDICSQKFTNGEGKRRTHTPSSNWSSSSPPAAAAAPPRAPAAPAVCRRSARKLSSQPSRSMVSVLKKAERKCAAAPLVSSTASSSVGGATTTSAPPPPPPPPLAGWESVAESGAPATVRNLGCSDHV